MDTPASILILKPSSFGDIIHTLPAVHRLKAGWPGCRISWLVNTEWSPLLAGNPDVDEIIPFPRQKFRGLKGWVNFAHWGRAGIVQSAPDLALDFQGLLRTALIGRACKVGLLAGMADAREGARWIYDRVAPIPAGTVHSVRRYLALADFALGRETVEDAWHFPLPEGEALPAESGALARDFILLHPFARGSGKSLTQHQVEKLCWRLAPRPVVVVGKGGENRVELPASTVSLLNKTSLLQLIWMMRRAAGVISVDSGPAHLAAALGKPLVAIHTWSDPRRVGPCREDAWVWKSGRLLPMKLLAQLEESFFRLPPKLLTDADLEAIGDRAILLSDSCA